MGLSDQSSLSEAIVRHAEAHRLLPDNLVLSKPHQWLDGNVAHIRLTTAVDLMQHLVELATSGMNGIIIEDCEVLGEQEKGFLADVQELYATTVVQRLLKDLPVPVCAILGGTVSALGTLVALASDHSTGLEDVRFDFASTEVATLVLDVADSVPAALGPVAAETLRIQRPVIEAAEASEMGILTRICTNRDTALEDSVVSCTQVSWRNKAVLPRCVVFVSTDLHVLASC
jgi:hypothetical protein